MLDRNSITRILLIRLSAVGDVINTLPAVSAVRAAFPKATLGFIVEDKAKDVVVGHPDLDEVYIFPRKRWRRSFWNPFRWPGTIAELLRYFRSFRSRRYDVVVDFQGNLKGGIHSWLSGVPVRIGFAKGHSSELNHWFSTHRAAPVSERVNRVEKFLALLSPLGVDPAPARYRLPESPESDRRVEEFLRGVGCAEGGYVLVHPGTSEVGKVKRWPLDRFAGLAAEMERDLRTRVLIAWGPGERPMAEEIARSGHAIVAMETQSLLDLAGLMRRARLFVGADSGPLHLASAVGVPSVALFGPKDPAIYGPYNKRHRVVYKPNGDGRGSMQAITVGDAFDAVKALL